MSKVVDLSSGLSSDYEKLYESGKYTDVSIHVGKEPNSKIFLAHTLVLCTLPCQKFRATPADQLVIHMKISFFRKPLLVVFTKLITKFFVQL